MSIFNNKTTNPMDALSEVEMKERVDEENIEVKEEEVPKDALRPFAIWKVRNKEYRMKLDTAEITSLERKYKTNLANVMGQGTGGMPALSVMLDIAFSAAKNWNHGLKQSDMNRLFDTYVSEGGSQLEFYMSVYMDIFNVSGFYSRTMSQEMQRGMEEAKSSI